MAITEHIFKEEMTLKKIIALVLAVAMASILLVGCGDTSTSTASGNNTAANDGEVYTLTIGHTNDEKDSWHQGALAFKEYAEEHSNGRLKVEIFPNSTLGTEVDVIQSIMTHGGCDITFTGETMQTYNPALGIIGMPYLIKSDEHMEAVLNGEVGKRLEGLMEDCGMKVLGYFTRGPRNITSNKEIKSVKDMNNFIIRTPQSAMTVAAFEAIGAKPTPMALAEVFTSLQQGTIEGQENPLAMIQNLSFYEAQKYVIRTEHLRAWVYIAMNKETFDSLPEDLQQVVLEAGQAAQAHEHELFLENEKMLEGKLVEEGMTFVDVDQNEFADAMTQGVLEVLTPEQKELYEAISAANPAA